MGIFNEKCLVQVECNVVGLGILGLNICLLRAVKVGDLKRFKRNRMKSGGRGKGEGGDVSKDLLRILILNKIFVCIQSE